MENNHGLCCAKGSEQDVTELSFVRLSGLSRLVAKWRRERDSNPRSPLGLSGFQDRLFQPLTHPSARACLLLYKG